MVRKYPFAKCQQISFALQLYNHLIKVLYIFLNISNHSTIALLTIILQLLIKSMNNTIHDQTPYFFFIFLNILINQILLLRKIKLFFQLLDHFLLFKQLLINVASDLINLLIDLLIILQNLKHLSFLFLSFENITIRVFLQPTNTLINLTDPFPLFLLILIDDLLLSLDNLALPFKTFIALVA